MLDSTQFALEAQDLGRDYHREGTTIHALKTTNMTIRKGEFVSIMGPSGSGKSTLMNLLGGLDTPSRGRVLIDGADLSLLREKELAVLRRRKLGFVFQRHDLLPALTVAENLEFPLILSATPEGDREQRIREVLSLVDLEDKFSNLPEELSGGQQQRVGIARALVNFPEILFADEPTGNLDSHTSRDVMAVLTQLCRTWHLTLVLVTHDPAVAALSDRTVHFLDGAKL